MPIGELVGLNPHSNDISADSLNFDSLEIDLSKIDPKYFRVENGVLIIDGLTLPRLEYSQSNEPAFPEKPYPIKALRFRQVIIRDKDQELRRFTGYETFNFHPEMYSLRTETDIEKEKNTLNMSIADLQRRIDRLMNIIAEILQREPDDVLQDIPQKLLEIREDFLVIKNYYENLRTPPEIGQMRSDNTNLFYMGNTIQEIENKTEDKSRTLDLSADVLFKPEHYTIDNPDQVRELQEVLQIIQTEAERERGLYHDQKIVIRIRVTGYADDIDISKKNRHLFYCKGMRIPPESSPAYQDSLNVCLSKRRAYAVDTYLRQQLRNLGDQFQIITATDGEGRNTNPPGVDFCPGECAKRRKVRVSHIEFPNWGK